MRSYRGYGRCHYILRGDADEREAVSGDIGNAANGQNDNSVRAWWGSTKTRDDGDGGGGGDWGESSETGEGGAAKG